MVARQQNHESVLQRMGCAEMLMNKVSKCQSRSVIQFYWKEWKQALFHRQCSAVVTRRFVATVPQAHIATSRESETPSCSSGRSGDNKRAVVEWRRERSLCESGFRDDDGLWKTDDAQISSTDVVGPYVEKEKGKGGVSRNDP